MKILNYNKFKFINENSEFNQYQWGLDPPSSLLGPGYGFAADPQLSLYSDTSTKYVDNYNRLSQAVCDINRVVRNIQGEIIAAMPQDLFIDDLDEYTNFKVLRIILNENLKLDLYIAFDFYDDEFFGVFKNFNNYDNNTPLFKSDLFTDNRYRYIDRVYYLKLVNYLYNIYFNFFIPKTGDYMNLKPNMVVKDDMGADFKLKEGAVVKLKGYNIDNDNNPYIIIKFNDKLYTIIKNDYYYFKYYFEPLN
jgi:hypothetical protein